MFRTKGPHCHKLRGGCSKLWFGLGSQGYGSRGLKISKNRTRMNITIRTCHNMSFETLGHLSSLRCEHNPKPLRRNTHTVFCTSTSAWHLSNLRLAHNDRTTERSEPTSFPYPETLGICQVSDLYTARPHMSFAKAEKPRRNWGLSVGPFYFVHGVRFRDRDVLPILPTSRA